MGLDTVELVMELEEEFQLRIPDADAQRLRTVGDVSDYIWSRLAPATDDACLTSRTFYTLRRSITRHTGAPRSSVRPSSSLAGVLAAAPGLPSAWKALRREFPSLPDLVPPGRAQRIYERIVWAGAAFGGASGLALTAASWPAMLVGLALGAVGGGMVAHAFTSPWLVSRPHVLPPRCDLVRDAVMLAHTVDAYDGVTRDVVEFRVRRLVAAFFGAPLDDVGAETRFVEDLGAD